VRGNDVAKSWNSFRCSTQHQSRWLTNLLGIRPQIPTYISALWRQLLMEWNCQQHLCRSGLWHICEGTALLFLLTNTLSVDLLLSWQPDWSALYMNSGLFNVSSFSIDLCNEETYSPTSCLYKQLQRASERLSSLLSVIIGLSFEPVESCSLYLRFVAFDSEKHSPFQVHIYIIP
jgi:hypothetical protein